MIGSPVTCRFDSRSRHNGDGGGQSSSPCEGACLRPVHDPALQTECTGETHRMMQVPFLLNTGPEAQEPHS